METDLKTPRKDYQRPAGDSAARRLALFTRDNSVVFAKLAVDRLAGFFVLHNLHDLLGFLFAVGVRGIVTASETVFPAFWTNHYINFARLVVAIWTGNTLTQTRHALYALFLPMNFPQVVFKVRN
jgi:hypothetical protein